jgi:hypothetical protein
MDFGPKDEVSMRESRFSNGLLTQRHLTKRGGMNRHIAKEIEDMSGYLDLGSRFTPAVLRFASGHTKEPEPDCLPFGLSRQSLGLI